MLQECCRSCFITGTEAIHLVMVNKCVGLSIFDNLLLNNYKNHITDKVNHPKKDNRKVNNLPHLSEMYLKETTTKLMFLTKFFISITCNILIVSWNTSSQHRDYCTMASVCDTAVKSLQASSSRWPRFELSKKSDKVRLLNGSGNPTGTGTLCNQ